jgi:hypothetical protein
MSHFSHQDEASKALKILLKGDDKEPKADAPKLVVRQNIAQSDALKGEVTACCSLSMFAQTKNEIEGSIRESFGQSRQA